MRVAILGVSGMLGSMVLQVFMQSQKYDIIATTRDGEEIQGLKTKILDVRNCTLPDVERLIKGCDYVINCIGAIKVHIDEDDVVSVKNAIEVNGLFPHKLQKAAKNVGAKVLQIATDCVYDGQKGCYIEQDEHNAVDVYGKTKSLGEVNSNNFINMRCSIIGLELKSKTSLLEWFLNQSKGAEIKGYKNHMWNGITTYHFAKLCMGIIDKNLNIDALQHIVPADIVSKEKMLKVFADKFDRNDVKVTSFETKVPIDRTICTQKLQANREIWSAAGYEKPPTFEIMIRELKEYIEE